MLTARRGASLSQNKKDWGMQGEKALGQRKRDVCGLRLFLPNPLFTSTGVTSRRTPFQKRTAEGLRRHPSSLCEVFIKLQWITPSSSYPHSASYTTASLFILVEQKAVSVSTSVKQGRQTDGFKGSRTNKSFVLFLCEGSKASNPQKEPSGLVNRTTLLCSSA